ncbi:S-adenosyl-L-methionine-dependent methyltransferase [Cyathus striatus]|nr:S-adenosyl-L-methionine-dependent methyltransferase [Cyathus striatus]
MTSSNPTTKPFDSSGWSASTYNANASFVYSAAFTSPVLDFLAAAPGERILDVGCGSGELTIQLARLVEQHEGGIAVGTDNSESMIQKSRKNGLKHAFVCDAHALQLPDEISQITTAFDAVFSNAALHWCKRDPPAVIAGVRRVLKTGGRFVGEMGGFMNCIGPNDYSGVRSALQESLTRRGYDFNELDPWYFPSAEDYTKLLVAEGFNVEHAALVPRVTPLPTGIYGWLQTFARGSIFRDFKEEEAHEIMREVENKLRIDCQDSNGKWAMMYVRLRFVAVKQ